MIRFVTVANLRATVEQVRATLSQETVPALIELKKELLTRATARLERELEVADL